MEGRRFNIRWLLAFVALALCLSVLVHYHFKTYINDYINTNYGVRLIPPRMKAKSGQGQATSRKMAVAATPAPSRTGRVKLIPKSTDPSLRPVPIHKDLEIVTQTPSIANPTWAKLKTARGQLEIMVYPKNVDVYVSASLLATGTWEPGELTGMEALFQCDPDLGLLDIGANIGIYVLLGAKYGRQVIGVEPSMDNMARLYESVYRNHYQPYATLIHNAVSNKYTTMELTANPANRGNTVIRDAKDPTFHVQGEFEVRNRLNVGSVKTILMDDLIQVVKFKRGILKIDIEGAEPLAFEHSRKFLTQVDVPYIFMEWLWVKKDQKQAKFLYDYFTSFGYKAFQDATLRIPLANNYLMWPTDVFWVKPGKTGPCKVGLTPSPPPTNQDLQPTYLYTEYYRPVNAPPR